jgi:hypothetical protein
LLNRRNGSLTLESIKALEFYDAYFRAELSANFQSLEAITVVPQDLKTEMSKDRDKAKADVFVGKTILECETITDNDESISPEYNSILIKQAHYQSVKLKKALIL